MLTCRAILETSGIGFLATAPVVVANYLAAYAGFELADERLSAIDNALGLDWHAFVNFVDARPWLAYSLDAAYQSLALQLVLLPVLLSIGGERCEHTARSRYSYLSV
ncbi:phosphatase PAP2 family protein [Aliirhizobium terrae]|uniref:phosphatase PAP2 family protein n=1 Tax=Terrirhizobium terrae TaxID=2926709 RepID=UPI00336AB4F7